MTNGYAIFSINRNCWVYKFDQDQNQVSYRNEPTIFQKTPGDIAILTQKISNATGDELKVYNLTPYKASYKPSLVSEMSKYTSEFSPQVAEFIHNTAIHFGNSREDKLNIAQQLTKNLDKALKESLKEMSDKYWLV